MNALTVDPVYLVVGLPAMVFGLLGRGQQAGLQNEREAPFVSHMNKVGRQLASSVDHYNKAVGSLERSVLPGARKFVELGVRSKKEVEKLEILESTPRTMVEGDDS